MKKNVTKHRASGVAAFLFCLLPSAFCSAQEKFTFQDHVLPVFRNACVNCHNPDKKRAELDLSTYAGVMAGGGSGKSVEPGDPEGSLLFRLVTHAEEPAMPPKGDKLSEKDLNAIKQWIAGGVLEAAGSTAVVSDKPKLDLTIDTSAGKPAGPPPMPGDLLLEPPVRTTRSGAIGALASSPWAPLVAVGGQKQVLLYNPQTRELLGVLPFPEGFPNVLKFSRSGKLLLVAGGVGAKSGKAVLFDVETGNRVTEVGDELDAVLAADISPDQSLVALGGPNKVVSIFSTASGAMVGRIRKHTEWITSVAFSPDGVLLATGDRNGGLFVWEAATTNEFYNLPGHKAAVTDAAFRADSNLLATSGEDGEVKLWNMGNGNAAQTIKAHGGGATSVDFAPDGRLVTAGRDKRIKTWKPDGGAIKAYPAFDDIALHAVFDNSDGAKLAIGADWTGVVGVFDVASAKLLGSLDANPATIPDRLARTTDALVELRANSEKLTAQLIAAGMKLAEAATEKEQLEVYLASLTRAAIEAEAKLAAATQAGQQAAAAYPAAVADAKAKRAESEQRVQVSLQAKAALDTAEAEYDTLTADLTAAQTAAVAATDAAAKPGASAEAKSAAEQATAKIDEVQKALAAKSDQLKSLGDAAVKALGEATAAAEARKSAQQAADAARQATERAIVAQAEAATALASAQRSKVAAEQSLPKFVERVAALSGNIEKLKPRVEQAIAEAEQAKQQIARLQAGQFFTQVYTARQELAARQIESDKAAAESQAALAAVEKATADVPAFEKRIAEFPKTLASLQSAVPLAEQTATAAANLAKALAEITAQRESFTKESLSHATKVAELASKEAGNKALADASAASKTAADLLAGELTKMQENLKSRQAAAQSAADALATTKATLDKEKLDQQDAPKTLESLRAAIPVAQAAADEKKKLAEAALQRLAEAKTKEAQLAAQYAELKKQLGLQIASR